MREKFKRFWDTSNPDLLRLVIIFVLVGLLLAGLLTFRAFQRRRFRAARMGTERAR